MNRLIARVIGEGQAARSDQRPPRPKPEISPKAETPSDDTFNSVADQKQSEANLVLGNETPKDEVMAMWRAGSKYDACHYMLFSNFLYTDFVRIIQELPVAEGIEMGNILDEEAPTYEGPAYKPSDEVAAAAGAGGAEMTLPAPT